MCFSIFMYKISNSINNCKFFWFQQKGSGSVKSKISDLGLTKLSLEEKGDKTEPTLSIKPLPPPPAPLSPVTSPQNSPKTSPTSLPPKISLDGAPEDNSPSFAKESDKEQHFSAKENIPDEDFGDFQAAG